MEDADLVDREAGKMVARRGWDAVYDMVDASAAARNFGDSLSAEAWLDLAIAAVRQLRAAAPAS